MYAIFETGGKQYQAEVGSLLNVDRLQAEVGAKVRFNQVLLVKEDGQQAKIGRPYVKGAAIETEVIDQTKGKKIFVRTFKRRQGEHKQSGQRHHLTCVKILKIGS